MKLPDSVFVLGIYWCTFFLFFIQISEKKTYRGWQIRLDQK